MMRRSLVACLLAAAAALLVATPALAQGPVKIGVLTPLSPPGDAGAGQFIVRGAKMARRRDQRARAASSAAGRSSWSSRTTPARRRRASPGFRKLAAQDQVARCIGQFHSSVMDGRAGPGRAVQDPGLLHAGLGASGITEKHLNYTFRTHVIDPDRVPAVEPLDQAAGASSGWPWSPRTPTTASASSTRPRSCSRRCGVKAELKSIIFDRAVVDLTPQLLEIKSWKPDLVLNVGVGTPAT